jgi:hypothetical protein
MSKQARVGGSKIGSASDEESARSTRHLRLGWWSLLVFVLLGLVLEALHGFKVGWYLESTSSARRLAWTLAHAHGTLLAVVNLVLGATHERYAGWTPRSRRFASNCLIGATVILPAGFFLGGLFPYEGDPGLGILLVPLGGGLLALAVLSIALASRAARADRSR